MQIQTSAFLLGSQNIHSSKSNKDFVKFNFVIEGEFCSFFTLAKSGNEFLKAKPCTEFNKSHNPTPCTLDLEIRFTEKGTYCDLRGIA